MATVNHVQAANIIHGFDYSKEAIDSLWQAFRIGGYMILYGLGGKKLLGVTNPSTKMDFTDGGKLMAYLTAAILTDDYALSKGWYKDKISK